MSDINKNSEAYHTGFESHNQGEPRTACPYLANTIDAINWAAGWDAEA